MDPRELLSFIRRHLHFIIVSLIVALVLGGVYTRYYDPGTRGATLFLTVGWRLEENGSNFNYPTNQTYNMVDEFTETIQGWLLNPNVAQKIDEQANMDVQTSFRKQERQNLVITVTVPSGESAEDAAQAVAQIMNEELNSYDTATNNSFVFARQSISAFESSPKRLLNELVAGLLGLVLALGLAGLWEYMTRRLTFSIQAEQIWGAPIFHRIRKANRAQELEWLFQEAKKKWGEAFHIVEAGKIGLKDDKTEWQTQKNQKKDLALVFIQLGKTREEDLHKARFAHGENAYLIMID